MKTSFKNFRNGLSNEDMKKITGGYGGGGTCGYSVTIAGESFTDCGVSKATATGMASTWGGYWCCDSCGQSSYCG